MREVPMLTELNITYQIWHDVLKHIPKPTRYTLGTKVDNLFTDLIGCILTARYAKGSETRAILLRGSRTLDLLKYFMTLLWQIHVLKHNTYAQLADKLSHIGNMLGKWIARFPQEKRNPDITGE
ncbi:MAG: four helix bundle protein [Candidatus Magasanikbacteria bacterium]